MKKSRPEDFVIKIIDGKIEGLQTEKWRTGFGISRIFGISGNFFDFSIVFYAFFGILGVFWDLLGFFSSFLPL